MAGARSQRPPAVAFPIFAPRVGGGVLAVAVVLARGAGVAALGAGMLVGAGAAAVVLVVACGAAAVELVAFWPYTPGAQ